MFIGLLVASVAVISVCVVFIYSEVSFAELSSYMASSPFRQERHVAFGSLLPCRTTVISAYFLFKSKHSPAEYDKWMRTFMASVSGAPLVMFIDTSSYEKYKHLRKSMRTTFVVYGSVWQIMGELETERNRTYAESYLVSQRHIDPERKIHTSELYAIWNLKAFMVNKVLDKNPYKSEFFIYSDAGAWRSEQPIENWPSEQFVDEVAARIEDRMLFGKVNRKDPIAPGKKVSIEGTFFAGSTKAMRDYKRAYYDMHDKMLDARLFIGSDQLIMNHVVFNLDAQHRLRKNATVLIAYKANCGNKWFFYQRFLASRLQYSTEMQCPKGRMDLLDTTSKHL